MATEEQLLKPSREKKESTIRRVDGEPLVEEGFQKEKVSKLLNRIKEKGIENDYKALGEELYEIYTKDKKLAFELIESAAEVLMKWDEKLRSEKSMGLIDYLREKMPEGAAEVEKRIEEGLKSEDAFKSFAAVELVIVLSLEEELSPELKELFSQHFAHHEGWIGLKRE